MLLLNRDSVAAFLPGNAVPTRHKVTNLRRFASEVFEKFSEGPLVAAPHGQGRQPDGGAAVRPRNQRPTDAPAGGLGDDFLPGGTFLLFSCGD
jgi:hypothetical protein